MIDPRDTVVSIARELGVNPWQALSVWQQESGGSTDTNLLGKPLSRNRGNAVGPWQVVPAYHPNFPVGGSFEDQTRYALGYLKDVGPAGYYGTGKPPPGDPTSDQYVAQVNARAAQLAQAGRPDIQQGLFAEAKPMAGQQAPQPMAPQQQMMPPMGMPQMQPPGFWDKLTGSPAFNMGLGILASNKGNYGAAGPAIGRGALLGMQNAGSLQEGRAEQMYRQMQMQQAQMKYQKDLQDAAKVDAWVATLSPEEQQLAGIIGADKLAQFKLEQQKGRDLPSYGVQPHYERDADGNVYAVQYASDGTRKATKLENAPFAVESRTPEFQRNVAEEVAAGKETGTKRAEAQINFGTAIDKADQGLRVVDDLLNHPGQRMAVGLPSMFPSVPGGQAANYEAKVNQLQGKMFLEAFESLKGGGQITEVEGIKATQAISDLSTTQSVTQHRKSLEVLREIFQNAKRRAAEKAGMPLPTQPIPSGVTIERIGD